jgi:glycerophosphoryl diester phosphodiesterase
MSIRPVLVCHRGASALAPENSLEAFRIAMHYGIDFSELDVYVDDDGDLVVTHDPPAHPALPLLQEVFDLARGQMGVYVELKGPDTGTALSALVRRGAADGVRLISGSFSLELVEELRQAAPDIPRSILFGQDWRGRPDAMIRACRELEVSYAHACFRPIEPSLIHAFHDADLRVMTPHTNAAAEARYFAGIGVDVIASDDPRILTPLQVLTGA